MTIDNATAGKEELPFPKKPPPRGMRWMASGRLWLAALALGLMALVLSIVMPARQRLAALRYLDEREIEYELSPRNEWIADRLGDRGRAFHDMKRIYALGVTEEDLIRIAQFTEASHVHCALNWPPEPVDERSIVALKGLTQLDYLSLVGERFTDDALAEVLSARPPLSVVTLTATRAGHNTLRAIEKSDTLTTMMLNGGFPQDADFAGVLPPPHLKNLYLWGRQRGDQAAIWASNAQELQSIQLLHCQITDEGLSDIAQLKNLESVDIRQCPHVTTAGIAHLTALPRLRSLQLDGELLTPETLPILQRMPKLESVNNPDGIDPDVRAVLESQWPSGQ
jgi:hypothetical protein